MTRQIFLITAIIASFTVTLLAQQTAFEPGLTGQIPQVQCRIPLKNQPNDQIRIISGKIVGHSSHIPIPNCKVSIKGTTYNASCNADGIFSLKIPVDQMNDLLLVMEIKAYGYKKQQCELPDIVKTQDIALLPIQYKQKHKKEKYVKTICPHF